MRAARILVALAIVASAALVAPAAGSAPSGLARCGPDASAGTLGVGDPYYPRFGNGGYDVQHYDLAIRYGPRTNHLRGVATITALTTQSLSCFSLDLVGLTVHAITVNGDPATWSRTHHELMIDSTVVEHALPSIVCRLDAPTADAINSYFVSQAVAATGVKAVLSSHAIRRASQAFSSPPILALKTAGA